MFTGIQTNDPKTDTVKGRPSPPCDRASCFACNDGKCSVLQEGYDTPMKCKFYKTRDELRRGRAEAEEMNRQKGIVMPYLKDKKWYTEQQYDL